MLKVLVADDHEVVRIGMSNLLREEFDELQIVEAENGEDVMTEVRKGGIDLILLDILMPNVTIVDLLGDIRAVDAKVPILILTALSEAEFAVRTLKAGANGYITKRHASDELITAIRKVMDGGAFLSGEAASALAADLRGESASLPHESLSQRELQVFRLIADGLSVKQIAHELSLSDKTVSTYIVRIREKTGLSSFVEIARYAIQHELVSC